jgi:hypothetical protein
MVLALLLSRLSAAITRAGLGNFALLLADFKRATRIDGEHKAARGLLATLEHFA